MSWRPERVRVGTVGKPHGLDGSFRVSDPCGWWPFAKGSTVLVDGVERVVSRSRGDELAPLIALDGADDRTAIEALRGAALDAASGTAIRARARRTSRRGRIGAV